MNTNNNPSGDNNQPKMPKFNMNWIYTIIIVMLALLFFSNLMLAGEFGRTANVAASPHESSVEGLP